MGLQIRGTGPDGTEQVFILPDTGPTSTVKGWLAAVSGAGYSYIETIGEGASVDASDDVIHAAVDENDNVTLVVSDQGPSDIYMPPPLGTFTTAEGEAPAPSNTWLWLGLGALALLALIPSSHHQPAENAGDGFDL